MVRVPGPTLARKSSIAWRTMLWKTTLNLHWIGSLNLKFAVVGFRPLLIISLSNVEFAVVQSIVQGSGVEEVLLVRRTKSLEQKTALGVEVRKEVGQGQAKEG